MQKCHPRLTDAFKSGITLHIDVSGGGERALEKKDDLRSGT
jgi:hypothetical protein